jgi:hypothetical protein
MLIGEPGSKNLKRENYYVVLAALIFVAAVGATLAWLAQQDAATNKDHAKKALCAGLAKAAAKCKFEGLTANECDSLTGSVASSQCQGKTRWIVYASAADKRKFFASVVVMYNNGEFQATEYKRTVVE